MGLVCVPELSRLGGAGVCVPELSRLGGAGVCVEPLEVFFPVGARRGTFGAPWINRRRFSRRRSSFSAVWRGTLGALANNFMMFATRLFSIFCANRFRFAFVVSSPDPRRSSSVNRFNSCSKFVDAFALPTVFVPTPAFALPRGEVPTPMERPGGLVPTPAFRVPRGLVPTPTFLVLRGEVPTPAFALPRGEVPTPMERPGGLVPTPAFRVPRGLVPTPAFALPRGLVPTPTFALPRGEVPTPMERETTPAPTPARPLVGVRPSLVWGVLPWLLGGLL